jgi:orotate phosphoribosyltransferase
MADGTLAADINRNCRLTGSFTLRSGQQATEYFDKYRFEADPALLHRVAESMVPLIPRDTELLGGLELGGVPIAVALGQLTGLAVVFVRKEPKTYGTCKLAEGPEVSARTVTLIEDVITTGGAVCAAALALRDLGATVEHVVCAIDRSSPGENRLDEIGLTTHAVLTRADLDRAAAKS